MNEFLEQDRIFQLVTGNENNHFRDSGAERNGTGRVNRSSFLAVIRARSGSDRRRRRSRRFSRDIDAAGVWRGGLQIRPARLFAHLCIYITEVVACQRYELISMSRRVKRVAVPVRNNPRGGRMKISQPPKRNITRTYTHTSFPLIDAYQLIPSTVRPPFRVMSV